MVMNAADRAEMFPPEPEMSSLEINAAFAASLARLEMNSKSTGKTLSEIVRILSEIQADIKRGREKFDKLVASIGKADDGTV